MAPGMSGDAPMVMAVMWSMAAFALIFVVLRCYTRIVIVNRFGVDDHVFNFAWLLLFLYTVFMQISSHYGFGHNLWELDPDDAVQAIKYELTGQSFAVVGMCTAKWSLGLFLLHIIVRPWEKVVIWVNLVALAITTIMTLAVLWCQFSPLESNYDFRIPRTLNTPLTPYGITLGAMCVWCDFLFAIFPWYFLWGLQMPKKEKITIASSMSLGIIAGICGIYRTIELVGLAPENYLKTTVNLIVWSNAEQAITMFCIAIPVCRPLWKPMFSRGGSSAPYVKQSGGHDGTGVLQGAGALQTIGGSDLYPNKSGVKSGGRGGSRLRSDHMISRDPQSTDTIVEMDDFEREQHEHKLGINGPFTVTNAERDDDKSDEGILEKDDGSDVDLESGMRRSQQGSAHDNNAPFRIKVKKEFKIMRS